MQSPAKSWIPTQKGKPVIRLEKVPFFGPFREERLKLKRNEGRMMIGKVSDRDLEKRGGEKTDQDGTRIKYELHRPIFKVKVSVWF